MEIHKFKVGDKIKAPTRKTYDALDFPIEKCNIGKHIAKTGTDHCWIGHINSDRSIRVYARQDCSDSKYSSFYPQDLDLYEEKPKDEVINDYQIY